MPEPTLIQRERLALRELLAVTAERARTEVALAATFTTRRAALEKASVQERTAIEDRYESARSAAEADRQRFRGEVPERRERALAEARARFEAERKRLVARFKNDKTTIATEQEQARWEATTVIEAGLVSAEQTRKAAQQRIDEEEVEVATISRELATHLRRVWMKGQAKALADLEPEQVGASESMGPATEPLVALTETNDRATEQLLALQGHWSHRLIQGTRPLLVIALIGLLIGLPAVFSMGARDALLPTIIGTILGGILILAVVYGFARRQAARRCPELAALISRSLGLVETSKSWLAETDANRHKELSERQAREVRQAERKALARLNVLEEWREGETLRIETEQSTTLTTIQTQHDEELERAELAAAKALQSYEDQYREALAAFEERDRAQRETLRTDETREWSALIDRWRNGIAAWTSEITAIQEECARLFLDWDRPNPRWAAPSTVAPALRFGQFEVDRAKVPGGLPRDDRLKVEGPIQSALPALLPLPDVNGSLVIRASGDGRERAISLIQAVMLRLLTSTPPGKARFTIVDPVGLGENFAAFMHLGDYDEQLVTSRIWTEPGHIERKLAELTEHMEKVIQKYLRNEYNSIQEYNAVAGEVAEPFRVLVVANFPANFTEQAARRLVSIAQSGPKCGVYVLMSVDPREPLPPGCALADLEKPSTVLSWKDGRFLWNDPDFSGFPLSVDAPPEDATLTPLLHEVGRAARDASRVEVPFEVVAPSASDYWTEDTSEGIDVPLGRVGATKFQYLRLGKGTSQHVLLAGRTGSGKSTLLHALVTNAALRYSPDQVELYLIDFKKGVEFKTYAEHHLPHARVIAIESEREFGLSVLQRLDLELKARGEAFRAANVQDLAGFRTARPGQPMPRILLIVDEFQEFFVEDDKLAQEAALLLDRLVRQGRAFGVHALLGSQTLGGAFSLARSTLGQMAVRIALQCSESDAHLILSEDNAAARLLSRPGEAIYNDANGLIEGNHFFQVVWLGDDRRDRYLSQVEQLDRKSPNGHPRDQIVFEGNLPADIAKNPLLTASLQGPAASNVPRAVSLWLGDAVAIKGPTAAVLRRQSGANLLVVGQNEEAALGIAAASLISLAAQCPTGDDSGPNPPLRVLVLDGTPDDAPFDGTLDRLRARLPQSMRVAGWRDTAEIINEVAELVARRVAERAFDEGLVLLVIHDLARFRDLRKSDDDFGFSYSRGGEEARPNPAKQLGEIVRDGPGVGAHVLVWCDSLNNLNRCLDRQALREFEMRVLFQMSANDSSALIDNPAASRLGPNRAYFASEEEGRLEKFRPYGLPPETWWQWAQPLLSGRRRHEPAQG